ncbi:RagB/SusD family nutrient uptake outer membrane protein [Zhouia spongiae]|uniref:RagB/SusD family nutrient uptake outer membrane protein n=1 Tax=Zhouia spongiae TaxID=2202721 RepID=A0ABY3YN47_9FLAO|nr:RagB/SusD family nutrient uptake outer membrane protein [Zhouia spongiae]UNY98931.1 RagB/SusD family nutrient uptake outer membrane protein [Zhouia spongiae]
MKNIKLILAVFSFLVLSSCSIEDVESNNILLEENVITDETTAQNVLNRIYNSGLRNAAYGKGIGGMSGAGIVVELTLAGTEAKPISDRYSSFIPFSTNNVLNDEPILKSLYTDMYYNINLSNYFIALVGRGDANVSEARKNELLAEARFFRALSHFNLLKVFGEFYDLDSDLGIVISTKPVKSDTAHPRNSVSETYDVILSDLQFASEYGSSGREHFYVTATVARAFLAKVQLYMGNYNHAATNAMAVINNADGYVLESAYNTVFSDRWGPETLLASYVNMLSEGAQAHRFSLNDLAPSDSFIALADAQDGIVGNGSNDYASGYDPRFSFGYYLDDSNPNGLIRKYPFAVNASDGSGNAIKILRMPEVYLIYAEAEARRNGGSLSDALDALNTVRNRVPGIAPKSLTDKATLLEDIRNEKMLELYYETGETWFDLVRYDRLGDINISSIKPSVTSSSKLIYPIPNEALLGNELLVPNP